LKKVLILGFGLIMGGLLSACASLLNFTIPRDGYTVTHNIAYGPDARQQLDIYVPTEKAAGSPVIVFFYGGRWETGSKDDYLFAGQALASKGFITVIADYRLYPTISFPVFVEDSAKAFVWAHNHIATYGGNPDNIFVMGHSAGAYDAIMIATNESFIKKAGGEYKWLRGAIGVSGPYDFLPFTDDDIKDMFSTAPDSDTQPITFVHAGMPPMFLATGKGDTTVKPKNTYNFAEKSKALHNSVEVHAYDDVEHIGIILSLAQGFRSKAPLLDDVAAFVGETSIAAKP
jgi:acetyl esterase/lipase